MADEKSELEEEYEDAEADLEGVDPEDDAIEDVEDGEIFDDDDEEFVIEKSLIDGNENLNDVETRIIQILDQKIRPAVAKDGGDIKFKEFKDGVVKVQLQGSCSGCPSSVMTLKQGVQNLLCHYIPEVKEVISI